MYKADTHARNDEAMEGVLGQTIREFTWMKPGGSQYVN